MCQNNTAERRRGCPCRINALNNFFLKNNSLNNDPPRPMKYGWVGLLWKHAQARQPVRRKQASSRLAPQTGGRCRIGAGEERKRGLTGRRGRRRRDPVADPELFYWVGIQYRNSALQYATVLTTVLRYLGRRESGVVLGLPKT
jgi:hypothetical protein